MQDAPATRTATCSCGQVSVTCMGEPAKVSLCHCLACQKRTGSTYGIAAFFAAAAVAASGETQAYTRASDSGTPSPSIFARPAAPLSIGRPTASPI